jgi:hypothetical protein
LLIWLKNINYEENSRNYGIPYVTGFPEAFELIETGDILTR